MTKFTVMLRAGLLAGMLAFSPFSVSADDEPTLAETASFLSSYLYDPSARLFMEGDVLILDRGRKCAYDSKTPLGLIDPT